MLPLEVFDGWCVDSSRSILTPQTYTANVYSSYEFANLGSNLPWVVDGTNAGNLNRINWLLNQDYTNQVASDGQHYTSGDLQIAIWTLLGDAFTPPATDVGGYDPARADALVAASVAGQNFVPDTNQYIGLVFDPVDADGVHQQPIFAQVKAAAIGDFVWRDSNGNGSQDAGEARVNGVVVNLGRDLNGDGDINDAGEILATTTTGDNPATTAVEKGYYEFKGLAPGLEYQVQFVKPTGSAFTKQNQGDGNKDSDASATGDTAKVILAPGEFNKSIDAGLVAAVKPATLGDRVWDDKNGNGIQDAGELGIAGVTVQLKDSNGNLASTTTTDANGNYSFTVDPGTYSVAVVAPAGYIPTAANQGTNAGKDSNLNPNGETAPVTVAANEKNLTIDAGLYKLAEIGDRVWLDANKNGLQDAGEVGIKGVKVSLLDNAGNLLGSPVVTDDNGNYLFTGLKPGTYSLQFDKTTLPAGSSFTSRDQGNDDAADSDANANGKTIKTVLESGESDKTWDAGVIQKPAQARLGDRVWEDKNGNGLQDAGEPGIAGVTVQLRDSNGNLANSTTTDANGNYSFTVDPGTYSVAVLAPAGYIPTTPGQGSDPGKDSNIDANGKTGTITLAEGENNPTIDAGLYKLAELGDRVWLDANKNGLQDAGEIGVPGVKVSLLDSNGNIVGAPLTTDANGNYLFTGLKPGTYSVQFDKTTLPTGYSFTSQDQGSDDAADSDANPTDGKTIPTVLDSGESDKTWDAGVIAPAAQARLGDRVWEDKNGNGLQDAGEPGIAGVTVQLRDSNGNLANSTTTDANGNYSFTVDPGTYSVAVLAPAGYIPTTPGQGSDPGKDSNIDANGKTGTITLAEGENNPTIDAGLYKLAELGDRVWLDANKNGLQDAGETGVPGVKVSLLDSNGKTLSARH